jgi:hypothetical protein
MMGIGAIVGLLGGIQHMPRKHSFLFGSIAKLVPGFLVAAIACLVGGILFSHYAYPSVTTPTIGIVTPAGAEMMQMVRDEHELIGKYMRKSSEARQQNDLAAEEEMLSSRAAEQTAMHAASEEKVAETRALAIAANVTVKLERKVAAKKPAHVPNMVAIGEPLQLVHLASATTQMQPTMQGIVPPGGLMAPTARGEEGPIRNKLRLVTATMERVPLLVHSVTEWFYGEVGSHWVLQLRTRIS